MIKGKLFQMLATFEPQEWKEFEKLVHSPFFNPHEKCKALLKILKPYYQENKGSGLTKTAIQQALFKEEAHTEQYFRVVVGHLTKLLETFFIQKKFQEQAYYQEHLLRNALLDRNLGHYFSQLKKKAEKQRKTLEQSTDLKKGYNYFFKDYLLETDNLKYLQLSKSRTIQANDIQSSIDTLDYFFLIQRLYLMTVIFSVQKLSKGIESLPFFEDFLKFIQSYHLEDKPLLKLYYLAILMMKNPDDDMHYQQLQEELKFYHHAIPKKELQDLYTLLINHFIRKSVEGQRYYAKVLALYKEMAAYDFLCLEQYISDGKFKNIVTLGCMFKEFDWTEQFISTYQYRLAPTNRNSVYYFNLGAFYFYKGVYRQAQHYLTKVETVDIFFTIDTKTLLIRIYFETSQWFAVEQSLLSLKTFLKTHQQISGNFKKAYLNFIKILNYILKAKMMYINKKETQKKLFQFQQ